MYPVTVTREGKIWVAVVDGEGSSTHARNLVALRQHLREIVTLAFDLNVLPDGSDIELRFEAVDALVAERSEVAVHRSGLGAATRFKQ